MTTDQDEGAVSLRPPTATADAPEVYAAYGVAGYYGEVIPLLRLRLADGGWRAFAYYGLGEAAYDPALGIELTFQAAVVCLRGRNLLPLYSLVCDHAVRWVWEADRAADLGSAESDTVVVRIEVGGPKG